MKEYWIIVLSVSIVVVGVVWYFLSRYLSQRKRQEGIKSWATSLNQKYNDLLQGEVSLELVLADREYIRKAMKDERVTQNDISFTLADYDRLLNEWFQKRIERMKQGGYFSDDLSRVTAGASDGRRWLNFVETAKKEGLFVSSEEPEEYIDRLGRFIGVMEVYERRQQRLEELLEIAAAFIKDGISLKKSFLFLQNVDYARRAGIYPADILNKLGGQTRWMELEVLRIHAVNDIALLMANLVLPELVSSQVAFIYQCADQYVGLEKLCKRAGYSLEDFTTRFPERSSEK